jgi:hypothetical protein
VAKATVDFAFQSQINAAHPLKTEQVRKNPLSPLFARSEGEETVARLYH